MVRGCEGEGQGAVLRAGTVGCGSSWGKPLEVLPRADFLEVRSNWFSRMEGGDWRQQVVLELVNFWEQEIGQQWDLEGRMRESALWLAGG